MINGKYVAVVMPAYNAEKTLGVTVRDLIELVDVRILVDDHSSDRTAELARNQETCYREALACGADVVVMLHPDYQSPWPA